ncbi:MAG TPA: DEAD/DEAH box helicase [Verrucomicrobiae bacterium]|nr:DEAD/DEAH box helicase [Verrucomicrobiae bacterium]
MTPKLFSELGLSPELLKAIDKLGFEQAAPIQAEAIPILMQGSDVVGQSQTGSGKTAAFAIPAIEKTDPLKRVAQVLILCPTRELAVQVSEEVHKLALFKRGIAALPIYGGQSYERQFYGLKQGAQIVIGTPGRVMDHMRRGTLRLETVKTVILDEVDVMLNMGFRDDIELILQSTPKERQTVFFSATIPRPIQQLIEKYSRNPQQVRIEQKALTVPTVEQVYYEVDRRYKIELLTRLIDIHDLKLGIIFCNTKRMVDDLVDHLEAQGYLADRLHGDMNQAQRDRVMNKFRKSGLEFLVATDIAARGIDVDDVQVVFNYDLPYDVEDYVHRIGRTGRAGRSGRAISFVAGREMFQIYNIERFTKMKIQRGKPPTADEVQDARANVFLDKVRTTLQNSDFKREDHLVERLLEEGFSSTDIASALLHHLRVGDGAPAVKSTREEERSRPERPYREERPEPHSRGSRFENRREDRRDVVREAPSANPQGRARQSVRAVPVAPNAGAHGVARPTKAAVPVAPPEAAHGAARPAETQIPVAPSDDAQGVARPAEKTFSDAEILASVSEPPKKVSAKPQPKPSRRTPDNQTRLWMNVGEEMGIAPIDVVNAIAGETGLPGKVVGMVDIRERHLFADVASEHVKGIIAKLNRSQIKGNKLKVKVA